MFETITIVGVGLIGGSIGRAALRRGVARRVVGVGRDAGRLRRAVELRAISDAAGSLVEGVAGAELVVVCGPVSAIPELVRDAAAACPAGIVTDVGSTKEQIVAALADLPRSGGRFVGGHPIAGGEKGGVEHADPELFVGRTTILTPLVQSAAQSAAADVALVRRFWESLGAKVVEMSPAEHDRVLATISHLPHLLAAGLAGMTPPEWAPLTAGGWRDVTRIASGDPTLWEAIFSSNRGHVLQALAEFETTCRQFREALAAGDAPRMIEWLAAAKAVRDATPPEHR